MNENQNNAATSFDVSLRWGTGEQKPTGAVRNFHLQQPPLRTIHLQQPNYAWPELGSPCNEFRRENSAAKENLNYIHCEPSFTGAELQSLHLRVPSMPPLLPEVAVCVAPEGGPRENGCASDTSHPKQTIDPCFENDDLPCRVSSETLLCKVDHHSRNRSEYLNNSGWWRMGIAAGVQSIVGACCSCAKSKKGRDLGFSVQVEGLGFEVWGLGWGV